MKLNKSVKEEMWRRADIIISMSKNLFNIPLIRDFRLEMALGNLYYVDYNPIYITGKTYYVLSKPNMFYWLYGCLPTEEIIINFLKTYDDHGIHLLKQKISVMLDYQKEEEDKLNNDINKLNERYK